MKIIENVCDFIIYKIIYKIKKQFLQFYKNYAFIMYTYL